MRHLIIGLTTAASVALAPAHAMAQERIDPMAATVAQWFSMIETSFVGLADAIPPAP